MVKKNNEKNIILLIVWLICCYNHMIERKKFAAYGLMVLLFFMSLCMFSLIIIEKYLNSSLLIFDFRRGDVFTTSLNHTLNDVSVCVWVCVCLFERELEMFHIWNPLKVKANFFVPDFTPNSVLWSLFQKKNVVVVAAVAICLFFN